MMFKFAVAKIGLLWVDEESELIVELAEILDVELINMFTDVSFGIT